jgi:hypothetical protein
MKILPSRSASFLTCILQKEPVSQLVNLKWVPILIETGKAGYLPCLSIPFSRF